MPGSDIEAELPVLLEELLQGGRRRITLDGRNLDPDIPRGVRESTVLRLASQGWRGVGGGPPGDVFLRARMVPHPRYRVTGDDLETDLPRWPWQAVLGGEDLGPPARRSLRPRMPTDKETGSWISTG